MSKVATLKRSVSLWQLTLYGTGTILGAGIYVLVGKIAGEAGYFTPWSFLLAAIIASFSGLSYAEMSARYPKSAGEVNYVFAAFNNRTLSWLVGWTIIATGIISAATLANGFAGYAQVFFDWPKPLIIIVSIILLGSLAITGITASITTAAIVTILEVIGLLIVISVGSRNLLQATYSWENILPKFELTIWSGIMAGSFLAFYAFIGFEDMVNIAEEVIEPEKNIPKAIILALSITMVLYILIAFIAIVNLPVNALAASDAPLALLVEKQGFSPVIISSISLIAIINGALVQIIMASRVLYGMADRGIAPTILKQINAYTHTPIAASILVIFLIITFALALPLVKLAKITSFIVLFIFLLVNLSLIIVKQSNPSPKNVYTYPSWIPKTGFLLCLALLLLSFLI